MQYRTRIPSGDRTAGVEKSSGYSAPAPLRIVICYFAGGMMGTIGDGGTRGTAGPPSPGLLATLG